MVDSGWSASFSLAQQRNYSDRTVTAYSNDIERFIGFFVEDPANANAQDILRFTAHLKRRAGSSSISRCLSAVRSFYNFLLSQGEVPINPQPPLSGQGSEAPAQGVRYRSSRPAPERNMTVNHCATRCCLNFLQQRSSAKACESKINRPRYGTGWFECSEGRQGTSRSPKTCRAIRAQPDSKIGTSEQWVAVSGTQWQEYFASNDTKSSEKNRCGSAW